MAATIAVASIGASVPVQVDASSVAGEITQFVEADFGAYLDRVNEGVSFSKAKTAKDAFVFVNQGVEIYGEDWRFNAWVGDYHLDFTSGEVTAGGYATGAIINVRVGEESLFTASRDGDQVKIDNGFFDLDVYSSTTTPFILTGQASWGGIGTISSADLALACVIYDFMVEESAKQQATTEPEVPETIDGLYDFIVNGNFGADFEKRRNEANSSVVNGWKEFSDVRSMIPNSNGFANWQSGLWTITVFGQKLTNTGLEQGFITATYAPTGNILRFSFAEDGNIRMEKKKAGTYVDKMTYAINPPASYGVINFANDDKIDTELIALAAAVDQHCSAAPRE